MMKRRNFRKRSRVDDGEDDSSTKDNNGSDDEQERRLALEEVKFLQKQRERKLGVPAVSSTTSQVAAGGGGSSSSAGGLVRKVNDKGEGDGENDELVLQDTFAQETAVMEEDPNMLRYVEQELAKKRGKNVDVADQVENEVKRAEDELYKIPEHLKVKRRNSEESSTQWTTGIAEIQLPIEYKLKNIEETEAAKKLLQEKRLMGRARTESSIPSSYSADYFQRGKDYAEKLRKEYPPNASRTKFHSFLCLTLPSELWHSPPESIHAGKKLPEHPDLYKEKSKDTENSEPKPHDSTSDGAVKRQAATDQFMLERFRKRDRHRGMRR
uniref:Hepatocellular carcinoma-associated antigen 59 family protein n=1 Tax=Solanum tuberosum TaxID=4113 RepID=M0ZJS3_SOLTU